MSLTYNGTADKADDGYSSGVSDLNLFYEPGHLCFIVISSVLVLLMIPGVGFFYSGLARRKSALTLILLSVMSVAVISFQWFFWGYSLTFSRTGNSFLGDLTQFGLMETIGQPNGSAYLPDILLCLYQGMFAAITPALAIGAVADRGRVLPAIVFMFLWSTLVYDPIAYWTWNANGWLFNLPSYDFAGGGPVHVSSGTCALAYSLMLGKRTGYSSNHGLPYRPHNVTHVVLGTVFLWVGWFGFNAGSALAANLRGVMAAIVTNLAACVGGMTWCILDYRLERKWSTVGFCSGVVAGLVCITPGSGYVPPWSAVIFGALGAAGSNYATKVKFLLGIDDALDIFAVHGVGGLIGNICTAFFASPEIAALDGHSRINGGWVSRHWAQMGYQLADSLAGGLYSFSVTCLILFVMNMIPGLRLRTSEEAEVLGIDDAEIGEFAYDYVELTREVVSDVDNEAGSRYSADPTAFHPYEKHSIPMIDARMFGGQGPAAPVGFPQ